jgi:FkbM family methyltransferase
MKIVQIGTNVGNDDLTTLIKSKNIEPSLLILIEPLSIHNNKINNCYQFVQNKIIENIAIVCDEEITKKFYYSNDDPDFTVASFDINHVIVHGYNPKNIISIDIPCMSINNLFKKYNLIDIDILFIDAEGYDDCILRSIDYSTFNIKQIYYENLHLPYPQINTHNFLKSMGYSSVIPNTGLNGWSSLATKE